MLRVFDANNDGTLTLDELVDMFSVFSEHATPRAKAQIAFHIFDYDEDGEIGHDDIKTVLRNMIIIPILSMNMGFQSRMSSRLAELARDTSASAAAIKLDKDLERWATKIISEMDTTGTNTVSYDEWEDAILTCELSLRQFSAFSCVLMVLTRVPSVRTRRPRLPLLFHGTRCIRQGSEGRS